MADVSLIAFDVSSTLAQFRKNYTTTSALTFSIPPPSVLRGLTGSILGLPYPEAIASFKSCRFGIQVLSPISKVRITTNYINTKNGITPVLIKKNPHIQVRVEYVREPHYRIFVESTDTELLDRISNMIIAHKSIFTPYLGTACCIARLSWVGKFNGTAVKPSGECEVLTAVPRDWIRRMNVVRGKRYVFERVPLNVDESRTPLDYIDLAFDAGGGPVVVEVSEELYDIGGSLIAIV